jgi:hypothetical protein
MEGKVRDVARPGHAEPSVERRRVVERAVFRPGVLQYAYIGSGPALVLVAGLAIFAAGVAPQAQDRLSLIAAGIGVAACGGFALAYVFGMSIEVDQERVSKAYLFGLIRVDIPLQYLSASVKTETSSGQWLEWEYTRLDFESSDGIGDGFSAYPTWVWRRRDMDRLRWLARSMAEWRGSHPLPTRPKPAPTFAGFLKLAVLLTYVCGLLAAAPLAFLYSKWGGLPTLVAASMIELAIVALSAGETWGYPRSAPEHPSRGLSATQIAVPQPPPLPPDLTSFEPESVALEKSDEPGLGLAYLLSVVAFLMLAVGIWAATQSHAWTWLWPLNVLGGLLSFLPVVFWIVLRDRLSRQPLFIWPARVLALFLTIAIPFVVWAPVPPPPS